MSRSTWLIARAVWLAFTVVFVVFFGLELVFRVLDEIKGPHTQYLFADALVVSISGMPRRLYLDLPLIVLIAVASGLGGLAQSSELTVLRAAGLSIRQIFGRILLALSPILVGSLVVAEWGMPQSEQFSQALRASKTVGAAPTIVWTREAGHYVQLTGAPDGQVLRWKQVTLHADRDEMTRILASDRVAWLDQAVQLADATTLDFTPTQIDMVTATVTQSTQLSAREVRWLVQTPEALPLSDLWDAVQYLSDEDLNARAHTQLFWQRMLLPVTLIILALLASATAFGSLRSLGMSTRVFLAVLLGLVFKYTMDMASPGVFLAGWHPALAIILPLLIPLVLTPRLLR
jgi:lipopolysaccharide export system permease protein